MLSTCLPNLQRTTNRIRKVRFQMCFQFHDVSCNSNFLGLVRRTRVCPLQLLDRGELRRWREVGLATDSKTREPHTSSANKKQAGWLIYLRDGKGLYMTILRYIGYSDYCVPLGESLLLLQNQYTVTEWHGFF